MSGNTIRNLTSDALNVGLSAVASVIGLLNENASATGGNDIAQNTVHSLSSTNTTAAVVVLGLNYNGSTTGTHIVQRNFIHSLSTASTDAAATLSGVNITSGSATYRNNIVALGVGVANAVGINGINETNGSNNIYHNSVYLDGEPTVGTGNSFAFQSTVVTNTRNYRNNIFYNSRSNAGATGKDYAVRVGGTAPNPAGLTISHNVFFADGAVGALGFYNGADVANIADWRGATGQDANSFESDPKYNSPTNATPDLHIHPANRTVVEGNGFDVGVTIDFDGQTRSGLTPVDIGADAGNFNGADFAPPNIVYTPLGNTGSTTGRTLSVTITDNTGMPTTGMFVPHIYYRKNAGAYFSQSCLLTSGTGTSGIWNCSIVVADVGGVMATDIIYYFVLLAPLAASVDVSGRVMQTNGRGVFRVLVMMTDANGNVRTTFTNSFGYYRFADVPAGATYIFPASHLRYRFVQPTLIWFVGEEITDVDFTAINGNP